MCAVISKSIQHVQVHVPQPAGTDDRMKTVIPRQCSLHRPFLSTVLWSSALSEWTYKECTVSVCTTGGTILGTKSEGNYALCARCKRPERPHPGVPQQCLPKRMDITVPHSDPGRDFQARYSEWTPCVHQRRLITLTSRMAPQSNTYYDRIY